MDGGNRRLEARQHFSVACPSWVGLFSQQPRPLPCLPCPALSFLPCPVLP